MILHLFFAIILQTHSYLTHEKIFYIDLPHWHIKNVSKTGIPWNSAGFAV